MSQDLTSIVALFAIEGQAEQITPLGEGLINDTYRIHTSGTDTPDYVMQRINTNVFPDVDVVMHNIDVATAHIRKQLQSEQDSDIRHHVLRFIGLKDNPKQLYAMSGNNAWRMMEYIDGATVKTEVNAENAHAAGLAFGQFQARLADVDEEMGEPIKDFHNMEFRLKQLEEACLADRKGRVAETEVQILLREIRQRAEEMTLAERLHRQGLLPKRICHCDTKVNNMLFSAESNEVLCVIDLDTVMPSFVFSDIGDFLRSAASTTAEDDPDFKKIAFRRDIYDAFVEGYLSSASAFITPLERQLIPYAARLFPYMQCVRFLTDYINGDTYYKTQYTTHNRVRAQNQYHYFKCIDEALPKVRIVEQVNWRDTYPYKPLMAVTIEKTAHDIRLHYYVKEQSIRAVAKQDNDNVWEDSCAEFFIIPNPNDKIYYNLECNCAGKVLLGAGSGRSCRTLAPQEVTATVERWTSLGNMPFEEKTGETEWELLLRIPKEAFFMHSFQTLKDVPLLCNIYKCGDRLTVPHFISLFPIDTETPDFHKPNCFQLL